MSVKPLDPTVLEKLLNRICQGATLVTFGRVSQIGLLPPGPAQAADRVECAWRRFVDFSRRPAAAPCPDQPQALSNALTSCGLAPLKSADAVMHALAVRDLWSWMDGRTLAREAH